jgi:hypothetical protein
MKDGEKLAIGAAGLSCVVPGLGQIVHGSYVVGGFWMLMTTFFWYSTRSWLAIAVHVLSGASAYSEPLSP